MFNNENFLDKQLNVVNILKRVTEEQIFSYYIPGLIINTVFCSPLRKDTKPSFSVFEGRSGCRFKDHATGESGNCIDFVQKKFNCTFGEALNIINNDMGLQLQGKNLTSKAIVACLDENLPKVQKVAQREKALIRISRRNWDFRDKQFWNTQYGVSKATLEKFNVIPVSYYWLNEFRFTPKELCYAYSFGNYCYKLYFPQAVNEFRFIYNGDESVVQGITHIDIHTEFIVITKSLKDVMVLYELGIPSVAPQAESILLDENTVNYLTSAGAKLYTLYDYDNAGIHLAWLSRKYYNTTPLFLSGGAWKRKLGYRGAKDISDYIKLYGKTETIRLIEQVRAQIHLPS